MMSQKNFLLFVMVIAAASIGVDANPFVATIKNVEALEFETIGCGSVLLGYQLPPCPSTVAAPASASHRAATTITELPIGGAGIGPTPSYVSASLTSVSGTLVIPSAVATVALSTAMSASGRDWTTITATASPVTITQTLSEVISPPMTTVTAMCWIGNSDDGILGDCTQTLAGPIATATAKSAAVPRATNPLKSVVNSPIYKALFGKSVTPASRRDLPKYIVARGINKPCANSIEAICLCFVCVILFTAIVTIEIRKQQTGQPGSRYSRALAFVLICVIIFCLVEGLANVDYCYQK